MYGCNGIRSNTHTGVRCESLPETVRVDNSFNMFWMDYNDDLNMKSGKKYRPSDKLQEHYSLICDDSECYISGFITAKDNFDADKAKKSGIELNSMTDKIYTYKCPLSKLDVLVNLQNVKYIELATKVNMRLY